MLISVNLDKLAQHQDYLVQELKEVQQISKLLQDTIRYEQTLGNDPVSFRRQLQAIETLQTHIEQRRDLLIKSDDLLREAKGELSARIDELARGIRRLK